LQVSLENNIRNCPAKPSSSLNELGPMHKKQTFANLMKYYGY